MVTEKQKKILKEQLLEQFEEIKQHNEEVVKELEQTKSSDDYHGDEADLAKLNEEHRWNLRLADRDRKLLNKIKKTLDMIDTDEYGSCKECGVEISFNRLKTRPVADMCIECKNREEEREERDRRMGIK